ncbi:flagellin [Lysinibacillus sp. NPDC096418]|uniref:flagellin N-terminal helical domain-containing protein n=1 Tax=Lysinibacillus sp. NPDC096418 TaxID=3364138 RepID=UPI0037F788E6
MIITHNLSALNSLKKMNKNNKATSAAMEKLSSGLRINKAADDAAGLAISEKMRAQIRGLHKAQQNIQDGISLIQTAEGGLGSIQNPLLQRLRELAIQAANDTLTDADREHIQKEIDQIKQGINAIANNTEFNGIKLLNGAKTGTKTITVTKDIIVPGYYETTPTVVDLSKATSITIFELSNPGNSKYEKTFNISDLVSGQRWEPYPSSQEEYIFSVDLVNNTFTTTALKNGYSYSGNTVTGVRINGLNEYEDVEVWASAIVSHSAGTVKENLDAILGSNLSDFPLFDWSTPHDTFITVEFHSRKYIPESITTITETIVVDVAEPLILQTGANQGDTFEVELADGRTTTLGIDNLDYTTRLGAVDALAKIDAAIANVSAQRSKFGSYQNRLEHTHNNSTNYAINLAAAESRIRDADIAKESMEMVKSQILTQASQGMLNRANQQQKNVLGLLR